jgi:hypothetical protein
MVPNGLMGQGFHVDMVCRLMAGGWWLMGGRGPPGGLLWVQWQLWQHWQWQRQGQGQMQGPPPIMDNFAIPISPRLRVRLRRPVQRLQATILSNNRNPVQAHIPAIRDKGVR